MTQTRKSKRCLTLFGLAKLAGYPTHLSEPTCRFLRGLLVLILGLGSLIALSAQGQSNYTGYYFNSFAGNAYGGNGTGSQAIFDSPDATAIDGAGNVCVADTLNYTVRKITPAEVVTTLAGLADNDGSIAAARKNDPTTGYSLRCRSPFPGLPELPLLQLGRVNEGNVSGSADSARGPKDR